MNDIWQDHERRLVQVVVRAAGRIAGRAATLDGARKPVEWLEDEFFVAMSDEIEDAGVKRRVAAEMFGASRRTFQRRLSAVYEGLGQVGNSLWWQVREAIADGTPTTEEVLAKFSRRPPDVIEAILRDMHDTGWLEDRDGALVLQSGDEEWTQDRFTKFVNAHALFGRTRPSPERLVELCDLPLAQVQNWLDEMNRSGIIPEAEDEAKWLIIAKMIEAVLHMVYQRMASDEGGDGQLWRAQFSEDQRESIAAFKATIAQRAADIDAAYGELIEDLGREERQTDAYVVTLCEVDQTVEGWTDV